MRRGIALALMMIFSSLLMTPLFAPDADANLPACCRRHGTHHCMMRMSENSDNPGFSSVSEKCPCFPAATGAVHSTQFQPEAGRQLYAAGLRESLIAPHTQVHFYSAVQSIHYKRGPPTTPLA
jgi:hypothetical protein